jgi:hypothetical protein
MRGRVIGAAEPTPDAWNDLIAFMLAAVYRQREREKQREKTDHHEPDAA